MEFKDLKNKAKRELAAAIKKQEEMINQQQELINNLQLNFDNIDRFKPGNMIKKDSEYYLIAGEPFIVGNRLKIPIRHHIYPILNMFIGHPHSITMNMSGAIDIAEVPLDQMDKVNIVSVKDMFYDKKESIRPSIPDTIKGLKLRIERCKRDIEEANNKIEDYTKEIEIYKKYDFDKEFEIILNKYLNSDSLKEAIKDQTNYSGYKYTYSAI